MNTRFLLSIAFLVSIYSCNSVVETEFGRSCIIRDFKQERQFFSSDLEGKIKFQLDESSSKDSGKVITGAISSLMPGSSILNIIDETSEKCTDCVFLFVRDKLNGNRSYKCISGIINVDHLLIDTKGRISFSRGNFSRMVFENLDGSDCIVIEKTEFVFY